MAEVKLSIVGEDKASTVAKSATDQIKSTFQTLRLSTTADMDAQKAAMTSAFEQIKNSGKASAEEIVRAERAKAAAILEIDRQNYVEREQQITGFAATIKNVFETIKTHWLAVTATIAAAWMVVGKAIEFAKKGAMALQAEESYAKVTAAYGVEGDKLLAKMKQVAQGMVDDSDMMQTAVKSLQQNLNPDQLVAFLEISRASARVAGVDVKTAFEGITDAVVNQTTRSLKAYGIVIDQNRAFEAQAQKLGIATDKLTEYEQVQALANAVIAEGTRQMQAMGDMSENKAEQLQKLNVAIEEYKETLSKWGISLDLKDISQVLTNPLHVIPSLIKHLSLTETQTDKVTQAIWGMAKAQQMAANTTAIMDGRQEIAAKKDKEFTEEKLKLLEREKAAAQQGLSVWQKYYNGLERAYNAAKDAHKKAADELIEIESKTRTQQQGYADLELDLRQKTMTDLEKYYSEQSALEEKQQFAMELTGQQKIDELSKVQQATAASVRAVMEDDEEVVSLKQTQAAALENIFSIQQEITREQESLTAAKQQEVATMQTAATQLESAMSLTSGVMDQYKVKLTEISNQISTLKQESAIDLKIDTTQAESAIKKVIDMIPKEIHSKVIFDNYGTGSATLPINEKIDEIKGKYQDLPKNLSFTGDFSQITEMIRLYSELSYKSAQWQPPVGAFGVQADWAREMAGAFRGPAQMLELLLKNIFQEYKIQGAYAAGTAYVPNTGLYKLHQGEMVIPAAKSRSYSGQTVYAPIININGSNKSPQEIAAEVDILLARRVKYKRSALAQEL